MNASRIVYVIEEQDRIEKYGFAYGTLADHGEIGEERFTVKFDQDDQTVWFDLYAFSQPRIAASCLPFLKDVAETFCQRLKSRHIHGR